MGKTGNSRDEKETWEAGREIFKTLLCVLSVMLGLRFQVF
jgi:hypothetical protein